MKAALNNRDIIFHSGADCNECCFLNKVSLCFDRTLRDHTICRLAKILDNTPLNDIFQI